MTTLTPDHPAIINSTTIYQKNVYDLSVDDYPHAVLKRSTNRKLGRKVNKTQYRGRPIYTLSLVARETCSPDCEHWFDCYDNVMPFAHRFRAGPALEERVTADLDVYDRRNRRTGYLVRLHVVGDFYSPEYVAFWEQQLSNRPGLAIYGYTRHHPGTGIGDAVQDLEAKSDRFHVRFSMLPDYEFSANNEANAPEDRKGPVICPEQTGRAASCGDCGLCWTMRRPITFIDH